MSDPETKSEPNRQTIDFLSASLACLILLVMGYFAWSYLFGPTHPHEGSATCDGNMRRTMRNLLTYSDDYDGRLPECQGWVDAISGPEIATRVYHCPDAGLFKEDVFGYAMNVDANRLQVDGHPRPETMPVVFDSILMVKNACSGFYGFPDTKKRATNAAYLDGHVANLKKATP